MFTLLNFLLVEVNDNLFFCACCKYLHRVSVLFFSDVFEDSQCLFPCFSFFCNDTITSAVAEIEHIPNALIHLVPVSG